MENQPGKHAQNHSKLTDKYFAGRGRALKEFSKRTRKAEEVEKRKHIQQLILSGKIPFDKQEIEKQRNNGVNGMCGLTSISSSSQLQQFEDNESDNFVDSTRKKTSLKVPIGSKNNFNDHLHTDGISINNLENHLHQFKLDERVTTFAHNRIPPRFRNNHKARNFKMQSNTPLEKQDKFDRTNREHKVENQAPNGAREARSQKPPSLQTFTQEKRNNYYSSTNSDFWKDWEDSVVVHGSIDAEYLEDIVLVDDNDNLDDVMVQQYVHSLPEGQMGAAKSQTPQASKLTPSLIQGLGNLKSTVNADAYQHPPGTAPNPPKGPDRWGGNEIKNINEATGWGDLAEDNGNWYDDGTSALWGDPTLPYRASGGWSWNS